MPLVRTLLCAWLALLPVVAVSAQTAVPEVRFTVTRFAVEGQNPLPDERTQALLSKYTGEYSGLQGLLAAADELESALLEAGHSFHRVSLPPQALDGGTVVLKVVRFRLGEVSVEGNQHFESASILRALPPLTEGAGTTPDTLAIARAVAVANRHPAKTLAVSMQQGEQPDTVDAVVKVKDRRPWTLFGVLNNAGSEQTGRSRISVGGQHSNLFGKDHILTGSVTSSPQNFGGVRQVGVSYQLPLYSLSGWATASYVRSDVDTGLLEQFFDVSGSGEFWALRFRQDLQRRGAWRHSWTASIEDRYFDNNVSFVGVPVGTEVRSRPVQVRWDARWLRKAGNVNGYLSYAQNFYGGSNNNDAAYGRARSQAKRDWNVLRFGANADQALGGNWLARGRLAGQIAREALIPGEQFGLGGAQSVRGFEERAVAGDNGVVVSAEVWTPPITALAGLRVLGFVDAGYKDLERPLAGEEASDTLASVGIGARLQWRENLNFSLDWGRVLDHAKGTSSDPGNSRWHLNVLYRY